MHFALPDLQTRLRTGRARQPHQWVRICQETTLKARPKAHARIEALQSSMWRPFGVRGEIADGWAYILK